MVNSKISKMVSDVTKDAFGIAFKASESNNIDRVISYNGNISLALNKVKASPVVESVIATPMAPGHYNISIHLNESVYVDNDKHITTLDKDGKHYVVHSDGTATEIDSPDDYVANLNKSTGSAYKKVEDFDDLVSDANLALTDTGTSFSRNGNTLQLDGDSKVIKDTQKFLPYLDDDNCVDCGYQDGSVIFILPDDIDENDYDSVCSWIGQSVCYILDTIFGADSILDDTDKWDILLDEVEADDDYLSRYTYRGDDFAQDMVSEARLVKSLLSVDYDKAFDVATKFMGESVASKVLPKYKVDVKEPICEAAKPSVEEMELDALHEMIVNESYRYGGV